MIFLNEFCLDFNYFVFAARQQHLQFFEVKSVLLKIQIQRSNLKNTIIFRDEQ